MIQYPESHLWESGIQKVAEHICHNKVTGEVRLVSSITRKEVTTKMLVSYSNCSVERVLDKIEKITPKPLIDTKHI